MWLFLSDSNRGRKLTPTSMQHDVQLFGKWEIHVIYPSNCYSIYVKKLRFDHFKSHHTIRARVKSAQIHQHINHIDTQTQEFHSFTQVLATEWTCTDL